MIAASHVGLDARSQFVGFACASIERCGAESPARSLAHNRALCEMFGRDWVVGCCRQIGTTITITVWNWDLGGRERVRAHVFMGVSATLGVVWCKWLDMNILTTGRFMECIEECVGDDRFITGSFWGSSGIVDSSGNAVSDLGSPESDPSAFYVTNKKWVVRVENVEWARRLTVWNISNGVPVSPSFRVKCTAPLEGHGARFSPFDPCGDELFFVGVRSSWGLLSSVHLTKGIEAGGIVGLRKSILLPHTNPFALAWASPDTILTLHHCDRDYIVYNTRTAESHEFTSEKYREISLVPPGTHITAFTHDSLCEVYNCASSEWWCLPSCQYKHKPAENMDSSSTAVFPSESTVKQPSEEQISVSVHDVLTGTLMATALLQLPTPTPSATL
ncbi:hypothetical protein Pelo_1440 [Pelomyxa schiedti]|nr:hypothetical protein Pelo_1440 [Pelomyxa schiedti]